jgi:hypothetical protein
MDKSLLLPLPSFLGVHAPARKDKVTTQRKVGHFKPPKQPSPGTKPYWLDLGLASLQTIRM